MRAWSRRLIGVMLALAVTAGIGWLSQFSWEADRSSHSVVRLAWRTRSARVEECRTPTEAELADVPAHMRRSEICDGRVLPYRLRVTLDGEEVADEEIHAAGAREDRPIFVYREFEVESGLHRIRVVFEREDSGESESENLAMTPARLELERELTLAEKEISFITYDTESRSLIVLGYGAD